MAVLISTHEADDAYEGVVLHLGSNLRVATCKDQIQWLVQRLAGGRWRTFGYCTTKTGLIRTSARFLPRSDVEEKLARLPEFFRRAI